MSSDWRKDKRTTTERGYGYRWQKARKVYLGQHPLCVMHWARIPPQLVTATIVDHKRPHQGDPILFWSEWNWQSLCATCHSAIKQRLEKSGRPSVQIGEDGFPV